MAIKTKWFGKKIKGEALENLIIKLGENPEKLLKTDKKDWNSINVHGKVEITPVKEGIDVNLYVFRTDYHNPKKENLKWNFLDPFTIEPLTILDDRIISYFSENVQGRIKY